LAATVEVGCDCAECRIDGNIVIAPGRSYPREEDVLRRQADAGCNEAAIDPRPRTIAGTWIVPDAYRAGIGCDPKVICESIAINISEVNVLLESTNTRGNGFCVVEWGEALEVVPNTVVLEGPKGTLTIYI
jgi:hypothetical protein